MIFSVLFCCCLLLQAKNFLLVNASNEEKVVVSTTLNINDYYYHSHHRHSIIENLKTHPRTALTTKDFMITSFSIKVLESIVDNQENNHVLYYVIKQSQIQHIDSTFLQLLDDFIAPRSWLRLLHVTMHDNSDNHHIIPTSSQENSTITTAAATVDYIILEKAPPQLFETLEVFSRKNFPLTQEECKDRPLAVHLLMGTWGNDYRQMHSLLSSLQAAIVYIFSSRTGSVNDSSSFNVKGECLDKVNKHQCLFLPMTACKLPQEVAELTYQPIVDDVYYLSTDPSAKRLSITNRHQFVDQIQSKHRFTLPKNAPLYSHTDRYDLNQKLAYQVTGTPPYIDASDPSTYTQRVVIKALEGIVSYKGLVLRENSNFRLQTQKLVETFRQSTHPHFTSNITCIWIHARKGDRILPDEYSMTEWCKTRSVYNKKDGQYEPVGNFRRNNQSSEEIVSKTDLYDLGCHLALPYGSATLEHFINASLVLSPNNRNIFISTDDEDWLSKALSEYKSQSRNLISEKHLQLFRFHPHRNHRNEPSKRSASEFFATIELGQQCEGFVGYTDGSAVAELFYDSMCYYHRSTYLECPPLFEFGANYRHG